MTIRLPARAHLTRAGEGDPLPYYFHPLTGWAYRRRLEMAAALLEGRRFEHVLEVGYGSGIFLPELCRRARRVTGIDVHGEAAAVGRMLSREGVVADLRTGSVTAMGLPDAAFDGVVCLSVLEHLEAADLEKAVDEIHRAARPGAAIVLGYPVRNAFTDAFFRLVGYAPREIHPSGHEAVRAAAARRLEAARSLAFPRWAPGPWRLYEAGLWVRP